MLIACFVLFHVQKDKKRPRVTFQQELVIDGTTFRVNDAVFLTFGTFPVDQTIKKGFRLDKHPGFQLLLIVIL